MIYLDYCATTPVNQEVLAAFNQSCLNYANPNSVHPLGLKAKGEISQSDALIKKCLQIKDHTIIYTSGATEANNLAILGLAKAYPLKKHIITTPLEHSSVIAPLSYLLKKGYTIDYVQLDESGQLDLAHLKTLVKQDTLLVSIIAINSELGIRQPITEIAEFLKDKPTFFHVDATQQLGKYPVLFTDVDLVSCSAHKIYGIKGVGCLFKGSNVKLQPIIMGGSSLTKYRSGTPTTQLITSFAKAIELATKDLSTKLTYVSELKNYLMQELVKYPQIKINSLANSSAYVLNISLMNHQASKIQQYLAKENIAVSTQSACASNKSVSRVILAIYKDQKRAESAIRISLATLTTKDELKYLISKIQQLLEE